MGPKARGQRPIFWKHPNPRAMHNVKCNTFTSNFFYYGTQQILDGYLLCIMIKNNVSISRSKMLVDVDILLFEMPIHS
jgi:hypothetical protein